MAAPVSRIHGSSTMVQAVDDAVAAMSWLKASDMALVAVARRYAKELDACEDDQRAVGYLGQQLAAALTRLGGAPVERKALEGEAGTGGALRDLRSARAARTRGAQGRDVSSSGVDEGN